VVVLLFITLIFTVVIWADIEECIAEEALLDYKLKVARIQEGFSRPLSPVHTLRFALRMRKFVLPWAISIATALIIVTESITAKNILLNLIAVTFIAEADNVLVKFTLSADAEKRIKLVIKDAKQNARNYSGSRQFQWPGALVAAPTLMMVATILNVERISQFFSPLKGCGANFGALNYMFTEYFPLALVGIENIMAFVKTDMTSSRFISFALDLCQTLNVIFVSRIFYEFASLVLSFSYEHIFWFVLSCIFFTINILFNIGFDCFLYRIKVGIQSNANKCTNNIDGGNESVDSFSNEENARSKSNGLGRPVEQVFDEGNPYNRYLVIWSITYWCYLLLYAIYEILLCRYPPLVMTVSELREKLGLIDE